MIAKKTQIGTRFVFELEYIYLNRNGQAPFVSQVHPFECDKEGTLTSGASIELDRVHNILQWPDGLKVTVAPGWLWRNERIIEVPIYEKDDPTVTRAQDVH